MLWDVVFSREKGRIIPCWQWGRLMAFRGRLIVEEKHVACLKRVAPFARLLPQPPSAAAPRELWDCKLVRLNNDYAVFCGYERISEDMVETETRHVAPAAVQPALSALNGLILRSTSPRMGLRNHAL